MSSAEKEYIKKTDEIILKASGKTLKKLQEIDLQTQLEEKTFYDAYLKHGSSKESKSHAKIFRKSKGL